MASLAIAITHLANVKKLEDGKNVMHKCISPFMDSEKVKVEVSYFLFYYMKVYFC